MRTGALAGASGVLLGPALAVEALAANKATGFRLGQHTRKTRVVIDLAGEPTYRVFTLTEPARLLIDLADSDWLVPAGALPDSTGHIARVRYGLLDGGLTRVVLDLTRPARIETAFALSPRDGHAWRLVVDVVDTPARAFRETAGHAHAVVGGPIPETPATTTAAVAPAPSETPETPDPPASAVASPPVPPPEPPPQELPRPMPSILATGTELTAAGAGAAALSQVAFVPVPARKPPPPHKPLIALDPGHGGRDPGAISVHGVYEKDITLAMGRELRRVLVGTGRYRVFMTRESDVSVRLRERVRRAREAGADLFVSIHADAIGNPKVRGLSVYTLSEKASDAEAAALAERENKADIILGMDLQHESHDVTSILIDLAQRETMNRSVSFANALLKELPPDIRTLNHSRRFAGFAVLKAPDVPSALLEMGYLSNATDEKLLRQRAYRAKLAQAVVRSLDRFFTTVQGARLP
ncbi:N-acetylmuramoyl-L-alanine amidase [uncultured Rhodospira sp.]|uniref:N-acetylmuramoyl-L-alanine amidase n=1 Tax=uncultured Rhodospira sp. TaxID=1936189 RepID=UPI00262B96D9|nr:N-acetylmuramoyl-L-alanine amidase [uncultured Rhodospira sp.]